MSKMCKPVLRFCIASNIWIIVGSYYKPYKSYMLKDILMQQYIIAGTNR